MRGEKNKLVSSSILDSSQDCVKAQLSSAAVTQFFSYLLAFTLQMDMGRVAPTAASVEVGVRGEIAAGVQQSSTVNRALVSEDVDSHYCACHTPHVSVQHKLFV